MFKGFEVPLDPKVLQDLKDPSDHRVPLDLKVLQDLKDPSDHKDRLVHSDPKVRLDPRVI